jgi:hypothetical protein
MIISPKYHQQYKYRVQLQIFHVIQKETVHLQYQITHSFYLHCVQHVMQQSWSTSWTHINIVRLPHKELAVVQVNTIILCRSTVTTVPLSHCAAISIFVDMPPDDGSPPMTPWVPLVLTWHGECNGTAELKGTAENVFTEIMNC